MSTTDDLQPTLSTKPTLAEQMAITITDKGKSPSVAVVQSLLSTIQRFRVALENQEPTTTQYSVMSRNPNNPASKEPPVAGWRPNSEPGTLNWAEADLASLHRYSPHQSHTLIQRQSPTEWKPVP